MCPAEIDDPFAVYVSALAEVPVNEKTELTDRDAVKPLLQKFAPPGVTIVHEPKRLPEKGAPDFKLRHNGQIIGYLETKPIGSDLKAVLKSEQLTRYRSLSKNIIVTDYLQWIWLRNDVVQQETLCDLEDLRRSKPKLDESRTDRIAGFLKGFTSYPPQQVSRASDLANELAS